MARKFYQRGPWRRLRRRVLVKNKFTCERCGNYIGGGFNANVHHIVPLLEDDELALEEGNLIPLCRSCHSAIHAEDRYRQSLLDQPPVVDLDGQPLDPSHHWNKRKIIRRHNGQAGS